MKEVTNRDILNAVATLSAQKHFDNLSMGKQGMRTVIRYLYGDHYTFLNVLDFFRKSSNNCKVSRKKNP